MLLQHDKNTLVMLSDKPIQMLGTKVKLETLFNLVEFFRSKQASDLQNIYAGIFPQGLEGLMHHEQQMDFTFN